MPDLTLEARFWIDLHLLLVRKCDWKSVWGGCPFLFICDIVVMGGSQGHGGLLLWCQVDSKEQKEKIFVYRGYSDQPFLCPHRDTSF